MTFIKGLLWLYTESTGKRAYRIVFGSRLREKIQSIKHVYNICNDTEEIQKNKQIKDKQIHMSGKPFSKGKWPW